MNSDACDANRHEPEILGYIVLLLPPLLWAGNFIVGRAARGDIPPMMLAFARHFVALAFLLPFGWAAMGRELKRYWTCRWLLVRVSLAGMVAFNLMIYWGLHNTTASNAQLMNSAIPVLIVLIGAVSINQRLTLAQLSGLFLSCAGVLTIILHGDLRRLVGLQFSQGDLIVFGGMVSFALFSTWLHAFPTDMSCVGLLGAQLTVAVVALFPFLVLEYIAGARATWSMSAFAAMLYVGLAASLLANLLYMFGIARVGPTRAGMFIHLVPMYGAILSVTLLGENLHIYHAVGMLAILAGLAWSNIAAAICSRSHRNRQQSRDISGVAKAV